MRNKSRVLLNNIMSKLLKSKILLGVMIVAVMFVGAFAVTSVAKAEDCSLGTVTLKQGMSGEAVTCLQTKLNLAATYPKGYFGSVTKGLVMTFQAANSLTADGIVGNLTKAALAGVVSTGGTYPAGCTSNSGFSTTTGLSCTATAFPAGCTSNVGFSPTTGVACSSTTTPAVLNGLAGTVAFTQLSQYSSEELGSGQKDVKIAGFELEASDGDVALKSFKLTFDDGTSDAGDSTRIFDYIDTVSIWKGTTKVGTALAADFTRDSAGVYSKTIAVTNAVVLDGAKDKFYVTADAVANLDSGDIDSDSWTIDIVNLRYEDGSGVVSTDTITLTPVAISFVSTSTASDTVLKISVDSANVAEGVVEVDSNNNTDNVVLLKGKLKLEGSSNVWLDALPITFTAATTSGSINALTGSVSLKLGDNTYTEVTGTTNCLVEADFSTTSTCSTEAQEIAGILFDNLDYTITAGTTVDFTISADINDLDATVAEATNFDAGDSLLAELTTAGRAFIVAENSAGDQLTNSTEMTGSATGLAQHFFEVAPQITKVSQSITRTDGDSDGTEATDDTADATLVFTVKAIGGTIYINGDNETTDEKEGVIIVDNAGTDLDVLGDYSYTITGTGITTTNSGADNEYFTLEEGETATFTVSIHLDPTSTGFFGVNMTGLQWGTVVTDEDTRSANNYNFGVVTDELETANVQLTDGA
jgi:peptidoglycan hydrolase-like protein with peptidoglycan-binding domain